MATSVNSIGIDINQQAAVSVQAVFTGAPVGSFELQASNDIVPQAASSGNPVGPNPGANVTTWTTLTCSVTPIVAAGDYMWNIPTAGYRWIRLHYTAISGTGTLNATLDSKG